jgi:hypothetical protein
MVLMYDLTYTGFISNVLLINGAVKDGASKDSCDLLANPFFRSMPILFEESDIFSPDRHYKIQNRHKRALEQLQYVLCVLISLWN